MQVNDLVNGGFELLGGAALWLDVRRLLRDRVVRGVYWPARAFYAAWGLWNLAYYPSLGQTLSFLGGLVVVSANLTWCWLAWRLRS